MLGLQPMTDPSHNLPILGGSQRRTKRLETEIISPAGNLTLYSEQKTVVHDAGDIDTTESRVIIVLNGETVSDAGQIVGQCQAKSCETWLTARLFRACQRCAKILCVTHTHKSQGHWFCRRHVWIARFRMVFGLSVTNYVKSH